MANEEFKGLDGLDPETLAELDNSADAAVNDDFNKEASPKITSEFDGDQCHMLHCTAKSSLKKANDEITKFKNKVRDLRAENENMRNNMKAKATEDQFQEALQTVMADDNAKVLTQKIQKLELNLGESAKQINNLHKEKADLEHRNDELLKAYDADNTLKDKFNHMKNVEEQTSYLQLKMKEIEEKTYLYERKKRELEIANRKLSEALLANTRKLKHLHDLEKDIKLRSKKGIRLVPKREILIVRIIKRMKEAIKKSMRSKACPIPG